MNSPLSLISGNLPIEIKNHIQGYMRNDLALEAIYYHIDYLYDKQDDHEDKIMSENTCTCYSYFNRRANRWKTRECNLCWMMYYTWDYYLPEYKTCILYNDQLSTILTTWKNIEDEYYKNEENINEENTNEENAN